LFVGCTTQGNATELIIGIFGIFRGLDSLVKSSLTGSVIGNLLFVLGTSILVGGIRYEKQVFNKAAAHSSATMAVVCSMALLIPYAFARAQSLRFARRSTLTCRVRIIGLCSTRFRRMQWTAQSSSTASVCRCVLSTVLAPSSFLLLMPSLSLCVGVDPYVWPLLT
jgi:Ca2+/H+ antiporter